jgi:hypothetical protein
MFKVSSFYIASTYKNNFTQMSTEYKEIKQVMALDKKTRQNQLTG